MNDWRYDIKRPKNTEVGLIHPGTMKWLRDNGYVFAHEFILAGNRRADFIARHTVTNEILVIECKANMRTWKSAMKQVEQLHALLNQPTAKKALVFPKGMVADWQAEVFWRMGIKFIEVEPLGFPDYLKQYGGAGLANKKEAARIVLDID